MKKFVYLLILLRLGMTYTDIIDLYFILTMMRRTKQFKFRKILLTDYDPFTIQVLNLVYISFPVTDYILFDNQLPRSFLPTLKKTPFYSINNHSKVFL